MTILFFVVYAGFIGCISLFVVPATCLWTSARIAQRNPEWLCAHPKLAERVRRRRLSVLFARVWGVALLAALCYAAFAARPLEAMTVVMIASVVAWTLSSVQDIWTYWRLNRLVPIPAKRHADLKSTRHEEHMPTQWVGYWHAALLAAIALYAFAYTQELVALGLVVARTIGIGLIVVFSWLAFRLGRKQPPQPHQRKAGIGVMAFCSLVVIGRIAQDFFDAPQFNEVWFWFFFAVAIQTGLALTAIRAIRVGKARSQKPTAAP